MNNTQLLPASDAAVQLAAQLINSGQPVAIPTETVYGLAADAFNASAAQRVFEAKGRPQDNPMIVHIDEMRMLPLVAAQVPPEAALLAEAFWPGPLTLILPKTPRIPHTVSAGLETVGVRMPAHPTARAVIAAAGVPLAAPSANRSGRPSPTTAAHVLADLAGTIPLVLDGGACPVGVESTVLALAPVPTILRPGFVTPSEIADALGRPVALHPSLEHQLATGASAPSPGMKYQHYAPRAQLWLLEGDDEKIAGYIRENVDKIPGLFLLALSGGPVGLPVPSVCYGAKSDPASQAAGLYAALRLLDERGAETAFAVPPSPNGVGPAVRNRLLRAANFRVIQL